MSYIKRDKAIYAAISADMENNSGILSEKRARVIESHINTVPPADVQPVTFCKNCVYWSSNETRYCNMLKGTFQENDYCSYGEWKGADE